MAATKEELLKRMSDNVLEMHEDQVIAACEEYIAAGYPAAEGMLGGLAGGMDRASLLYEQERYFVAHLILCAEAMYGGIAVLKPHIVNTGASKVRAVIGVVQGDIHDIGKNLVRIMMEAAGFEMYDLGYDVPLGQFAEKAQEVHAQIICLSALLTTAMDGMRTVIELLESAGIRSQVKVLIGGAPITQKYADMIGADGFAGDAPEAVRLAKKLTGSGTFGK